MKMNSLAVLIGGVLPALLLGLSSIFQKTSAKAGIATGPFFIVVGVVVVLVGAVITALERDVTFNATSALHACIYGVLWASGIACIAVALRRYDAQISQLVPLYNMNTLVAVVVGLALLAEWQKVDSGKLLLATALTITGGILAAASAR
jgi:hypothetical protein